MFIIDEYTNEQSAIEQKEAIEYVTFSKSQAEKYPEVTTEWLEELVRKMAATPNRFEPTSFTERQRNHGISHGNGGQSPSAIRSSTVVVGTL